MTKNATIGKRVVAGFVLLVVLGFVGLALLANHQEGGMPAPKPVATNGL